MEFRAVSRKLLCTHEAQSHGEIAKTFALYVKKRCFPLESNSDEFCLV